MTRLARPFIVLSALLASIAFTTADSGAQEEPPVVRALLDSAAVGGTGRPTYDSIDVAGDGTITITALKATFEVEGEPDAAMGYEIGEVVLAGVQDRGAGLFEVGAAEWVGTTMTGGGEPVAAIPIITATGLYVRQPAAEPSSLERLRASNVLAKKFAIPEAMVLIGGRSIVIEDMSGSFDGDPLTGAGTSRFAAERILVPSEVFEGEDNPLALAGYTELELAVQGTSVTAFSGEAVGFDLEMRLEGSDMGSLIVELGADGIPLDLFGALDASEPDPDALLAFSEGVSLKRARIRFEDNSLTRRLLSLMAEESGQDVATFVAEGTQGIDMMLSESLAPELAGRLSAAFSAYLKDPRSITLALAPAQPVQLAQVMAGLGEPAALIELLGLSVTAND